MLPSKGADDKDIEDRDSELSLGESLDEEDVSEIGKGRRKFYTTLKKSLSGQIDPEFDIHKIAEEVDERIADVGDADDLEVSHSKEIADENSEGEYYEDNLDEYDEEDEDEEFNLDDDEFSDVDEDMEEEEDYDYDYDEEDESEFDESEERGKRNKIEYLAKLEGAAYLLNPSPEDAATAQAFFHKMNKQKGDDMDVLIREAFWGSLKTEDGVYRVFAPNPLVRSVRVPKSRTLSQLQHSLEPKITGDPTSAGFKIGLQGWNIISRNFYYSDRQKVEMANGLASKMNRLEQLVKNTEKGKIDVVFSDGFRRGLPYVRQKRGKNLPSKKRSQAIQRFKKA